MIKIGNIVTQVQRLVIVLSSRVMENEPYQRGCDVDMSILRRILSFFDSWWLWDA